MRSDTIISIFLQVMILLFLLAKDKNDGEKDFFKSQQWKSSDVVITIVIYNIFVIILDFMVLYFKPIYKLNFAYLVSLFMFLIILGFIKVRYQQDNIDFGFKKNIHAKLFIMPFVFGSILFVVLSMTLLLATDSREYLIIKKCFYYIQCGFLLLFISPVLEEWLYRGIIYSVYRKKYGSMWAITISSLLFAVGHIHGIVLPFIAGIVCGIIYEKKESLTMAIGAHCLINAGGFIYMILFNQIKVPFT